jgi:hypothetical protein
MTTPSSKPELVPTPRTDAFGKTIGSVLASVMSLPEKYSFLQAELDRRIGTMERELIQTVSVLEKCNQWIAEAKPLLEKGGKAEGELLQAQREIKRLKERYE